MVAVSTRFKWFDVSAAAFARACPTVISELLPEGTPPFYVCPLCITESSFKAFFREAIDQHLLSEEHVPPASQGGRALLLTCTECNSAAGTELDAHAHRAERPVAALEGQLRDVHSVRATVGGHSINALLGGSLADGVKLFGRPRHNPPGAHETFFGELDRIARESDDWSISLQFSADRHDAERAAVSWLRAAYLATFAKLGYRFVLGRAYRRVRDKIADPHSQSVTTFRVVASDRSANARAIVVVKEPWYLRGLAIIMGPYIVFLPVPDDLEFYDRLKADPDHRNGTMVSLKGSVIDWPTEPELYCDFLDPSVKSISFD
ncbi:MAG: hypothetical protein HY657_08010 [Acidobacteria bacterium]|nr:hypothetical protein [Acidobacteriota bacterium]